MRLFIIITLVLSPLLAVALQSPVCGQQMITTNISVPRGGPIQTCLFGRSSVRIQSCMPMQAASQPQQHIHYHYSGDNGDNGEAEDELGDICQQLIHTIQQQMVIDALTRKLCEDDDDAEQEISALMSQLMMLQKVQNGGHHHHIPQQPPVTMPSIQQLKFVR